jgi:hypothetical protein
MKNSQFKAPLIQSAIILGGVIIVLALIASSSSGTENGGPGFFSSVGSLIVLMLGLAFSLVFSLAVLIAVFLAAVGMVDGDTAKSMYSNLRKNFAKDLLGCKEWSCATTERR